MNVDEIEDESKTCHDEAANARKETWSVVSVLVDFIDLFSYNFSDFENGS